MECNPSSFEALLDRLANLEKQNRRFKQFGVAGLVGVTLLLVMAQAPAKKTVEANEFILRDDSGNVRARLAMPYEETGSMPQMVFLDSKGNATLILEGGISGVLGGSVQIVDEHQKRVGMFAASVDGGTLWVSPKGKGSSLVRLEPGKMEILDDQGFEAVVGTQDLVTPTTGETHKTSAASLVLLDKNKGVIWKAP
jgi:hypothetical protein